MFSLKFGYIAHVKTTLSKVIQGPTSGIKIRFLINIGNLYYAGWVDTTGPSRTIINRTDKNNNSLWAISFGKILYVSLVQRV